MSKHNPCGAGVFSPGVGDGVVGPGGVVGPFSLGRQVLVEGFPPEQSPEQQSSPLRHPNAPSGSELHSTGGGVGLRLGVLDGLEVSGLLLGDTVGSDVVGLKVTGLRLGDLDGLEVSGLRLGDTVGSEVVGLEVTGLRLGDLDWLIGENLKNSHGTLRYKVILLFFFYFFYFL